MLTLGFVVGRFSQIYTNYSYELIDIRACHGHQQTGAGPPASRCSTPRSSTNGNRHESKITPSFVYNTVDNPFSPRSGGRSRLHVQFAGGLLGGTVDYFRPELEAIRYSPRRRGWPSDCARTAA